MNKLPKVSILTPLTYDRIKFKNLMMMNILNQDYPHELIEWVVVGDEKEETKSTFENLFNVILVLIVSNTNTIVFLLFLFFFFRWYKAHI